MPLRTQTEMQKSEEQRMQGTLNTSDTKGQKGFILDNGFFDLFMSHLPGVVSNCPTRFEIYRRYEK